MNKKLLKILGITAGGIGLFMIPGLSFFEMVVHSKNNPQKETEKKQLTFKQMKINHPRDKFEEAYESGVQWCKDQPMESHYIQSFDGLTLHAQYLPAKHARRIILLCHGYKATAFNDFANIAKFLHEHGCSLMFIDERCCGKSEGEYITFGAKEQYDIQKWTYYLAARNSKKLPIYLYGQSMGATSVLMASGLALPSQVHGIIADCGFQSMKTQLQELASGWFHLKWINLLLLRLDILCRWKAHFRMKDADATPALMKTELPILFFHGEEDTYVNPKNSIRNYFLCRSPKELVMIKHARHICSCYQDDKRYRKKLLQFFLKYDRSRP